MTHGPDIDPLAIVQASPAAVLRKDERGWVELFTEDALIEDPVGAAQYRGHERLAAFWRVFIAPQRSVVFHPHREFVSPTLVVRQVTIATVTPVSDEPLEVEAILEYRLRGTLITSMRAFWDPRGPVAWHLRRGPAGLWGLARHGGRLLCGLGLGPALAFGRAMVPPLRPAIAREVIERIAVAPREEWLQAVSGASVEAVGLGARSGTSHDPSGAFTGLRGEEGRARRPEGVIIAGNCVAAILTGEGADAAAIVQVERGRIVRLTLIGA